MRRLVTLGIVSSLCLGGCMPGSGNVVDDMQDLINPGWRQRQAEEMQKRKNHLRMRAFYMSKLSIHCINHEAAFEDDAHSELSRVLSVLFFPVSVLIDVFSLPITLTWELVIALTGAEALSICYDHPEPRRRPKK